jgi:hypothetical protein
MRREEEIKQHSGHLLTAVAIGDKTRRFADTVRSIHYRESVNELFDNLC